MGEERHVLGVLKEIRKAIGKDIGETIHVILEEDTEIRSVDLPCDLIEALNSNPKAKNTFEKKSYTFQKEHVFNIISS